MSDRTQKLEEAKQWLSDELRSDDPAIPDSVIAEQCDFLEQEVLHPEEDPDGDEPEDPMIVAAMVLENYREKDDWEDTGDDVSADLSDIL
ncbi:MAG TPA: hypothetical protein VLB83_00735 [Candidatus Paceibacterota bacterium]|nr:hypothetical protein [Candidatus Paceibacterota bacterium]